MKGDAVRWAVLTLTIILLAGIQRAACKRFVFQEETGESSIYDIDLKTIEKTWEREVIVETPDRLVQPIKQAFAPPEVPSPPPNGNGTEGGDSTPLPPGALDLLGVIAPVEGGGFPLVIISLNGEREVFAPGEALPNGWILQRVEDVGEREYRVWFHDVGSNELKAQNFKGDDIP